MLHALIHYPDLTQAQHRALPHVSNTDLSDLKASILGQLRRPNPVALAFGSHFHTAVLEPQHYQRTDERDIKWPDLETLARQLRRQRYCRDLLYRGQAEQSYTAIHTTTGVGVKLRPDLLVRSRAGRQLTLIDFKTSSAPDLPHFLATIEKYDYDRQAALYLDVLGALPHHRRAETAHQSGWAGSLPGVARRADRNARPHRAGPQEIRCLATLPRPPSRRLAPGHRHQCTVSVGCRNPEFSAKSKAPLVVSQRGFYLCSSVC